MLTAHPSPEALSRFARGLLPEDELAPLAEHLDACPECRTALPATGGDDPLVAALRLPLAPEPHASEPECAAALAAVAMDLPTRLAAGATPAPDSTGEWAGARLDDPFPDLPCDFGRYRLERRLGRGGMGAVYLAHDNTLRRPVALKVSRFSPDRHQAGERFLREARAAAALQHEGVCRVLDYGVLDGTHYLTMEYIDGDSLARRLAAAGPPDVRAAAELVRQVARALEAAHRKGVVHRDLKPSNIMLDADGRPRVVDFGLARRQDDELLTQAGTLLGTPPYMSPEQIRGEPVGPAADVYSLGVILYELLTGRLPFGGEDNTQLAYQIAHAPLTPPSAHRAGLDPALEAVCLRAMARNVAERYPSMAAFADDLDAYLRGTPPAPPPSGPRRRLVLIGSVAAASAALLLAVAVGAGVKWNWFSAGPSQPGPGEHQPERGPQQLLDLQLTLSAAKGKDRQLTAIDDPRVLPLREGDYLRIEARTARPAYFYVLNMDASGRVWPMYPWRKNNWNDVPEEEARVALSIPEGEDRGARVGGGPSGIESVLVLARATPLSAGERERVHALLGEWPRDQGKFDPLRAAVTVGDDEFHFGDKRDAQLRGAIDPGDTAVLRDPVLRLRRLLQGDMSSLRVASRGVCYTFQGE
jgi:predicted Ser/Thr protein kinase